MATILIVDDDPSFGAMLRQRLMRTGHRVDFQQGAFGTLNKLKQGYDLLIIDVYMPALDGTRLIQEIRRSPDLGGLRIILASSMDEAPLAALAKQHGADSYLWKAAPSVEIVATVGAVLSSG
ncbi:MAG TPA: response regulator [Polyangiaceae bacterium]|jgi:CheY-like chemotaxis protein|nr:response regulator [Polyangiaceae bacterium]